MVATAQPEHKTPNGDLPTLADVHAVEVLDRTLRWTYMPPYIPGEPPGIATSLLAPRVSEHLKERILEIHGNPHESPRPLRTLLTRILPLWKDPLTVEVSLTQEGDRLTLTSPTCPLAREVAKDPRRCGLCQEVQKHLVRDALGAPEASARFPQLITRGDGTCRLEVEAQPTTR